MSAPTARTDLETLAAIRLDINHLRRPGGVLHARALLDVKVHGLPGDVRIAAGGLYNDALWVDGYTDAPRTELGEDIHTALTAIAARHLDPDTWTVRLIAHGHRV